jgi:hypothetical protein
MSLSPFDLVSTNDAREAPLPGTARKGLQAVVLTFPAATDAAAPD